MFTEFYCFPTSSPLIPRMESIIPELTTKESGKFLDSIQMNNRWSVSLLHTEVESSIIIHLINFVFLSLFNNDSAAHLPKEILRSSRSMMRYPVLQLRLACRHRQAHKLHRAANEPQLQMAMSPVPRGYKPTSSATWYARPHHIVTTSTGKLWSLSTPVTSPFPLLSIQPSPPWWQASNMESI